MSAQKKTILKRAARGLAAVVVGFAAAFVIGPDVLDLVPDDYQFLVVSIVSPALLALEKYLRDGGDPAN